MECQSQFMLLLICCSIFFVAQVAGDRQSRTSDAIDTVAAGVKVDLELECMDHTARHRRRRQLIAIKERSQHDCYFRDEAVLTCTIPNGWPSSSSVLFRRRGSDEQFTGTTSAYSRTQAYRVYHDDYYQCLVNSSIGVAMSAVVLVQKSVLESHVDGTLSVTALRGELVSIHCPYTAVPQSRVAPKWLWKNKTHDSEISLNVTQSNMIQLDNGTLLIPNVAVKHSGIYRCRITHGVLSMSIYVETDLDIQVAGSMPRTNLVLLYQSAPDVTGLVGNRLALTCIFENSTNAGHDQWTLVDVRWSTPRNGNESGRQLVLDKLEFDDAGQYVCTGVYRNIHVYGKYVRVPGHGINLTVEDVPRLDQPLTNQNLAVGSRVTFVCDAIGQPTSTITWYINAEPLGGTSGRLPGDEASWNISESRRYDNDPRRSSNSLVLAQLNTGGLVVSCNASNTHGYALSSAHVITSLPATSDVITMPRDTVADVTRPRDVTTTQTTSRRPSTTKKTDRRSSLATTLRPPGVVIKTTPHVDSPPVSVLNDATTTMTSSATTPTTGMQFRELITVICVSLTVSVLTIVAAVVVVKCFKRIQRRRKLDSKKREEVERQAEQLQLNENPPGGHRLSRSSSTDSGIDDSPQGEAADVKIALQVLHELDESAEELSSESGD